MISKQCPSKDWKAEICLRRQGQVDTKQELLLVGHHPQMCLLSVYLTSLHVIRSPRPPLSTFEYRKQSKTRGWNCLGTRLSGSSVKHAVKIIRPMGDKNLHLESGYTHTTWQNIAKPKTQGYQYGRIEFLHRGLFFNHCLMSSLALNALEPHLWLSLPHAIFAPGIL